MIDRDNSKRGYVFCLEKHDNISEPPQGRGDGLAPGIPRLKEKWSDTYASIHFSSGRPLRKVYHGTHRICPCRLILKTGFSTISLEKILRKTLEMTTFPGDWSILILELGSNSRISLNFSILDFPGAGFWSYLRSSVIFIWGRKDRWKHFQWAKMKENCHFWQFFKI